MQSDFVPDETLVDHAPLPRVDGFPFPTYSFPEQNLRDIINLQPEEGDVFLSTYPKCGATWTQYILWELTHDAAVPPNLMEMYYEGIPFLEMTGCKNLSKMSSPRMFKIHLPYRLTPISDLGKYITVIRNPFDACVSYYNHLHQVDYKRMNIKVKFDTFVDDFINGEVLWGSYFENVTEWYDHRNDPNVLLLFYEDMKKDPREAVLKIAEFLGLRLWLEENEEIFQRVLKHTSFKYMRDNVEVKFLKRRNPEEESKTMVTEEVMEIDFFRSGIVGASKTTITDEQWKRLERAIEEKVLNKDLKNRLIKIR